MYGNVLEHEITDFNVPTSEHLWKSIENQRKL
jgi:hypothetical protein